MAVKIYDTECYRNYWLLKIYDPVSRTFQDFELSPWHRFDTVAMHRALYSGDTYYGFNCKNYDNVMIAGALAGFDNNKLKELSDAIIQQNMKPWDVESVYGLQQMQFDHVDLIEVLPGKYSLKAYGAKLHTKKLQDLPLDPDTILTYQDILGINKYCGNDCIVTDEQRVKFATELELRVDLSNEFQVDVRSKSDAQIAEALFKKLLPFKVYPPDIAPGTQFYYQIPAYLTFDTPELIALLHEIRTKPAYLNSKGAIEFPSIEGKKITIGSSVYQLGIGGMHSTESKRSHRADGEYSLEDVDVISYYPQIIENQKLSPPQIGQPFLDLFCGWKASRVAAKRAKQKKKANGEKTKINGTFGKTNSKYSILYAPSMMLQVTVTGQLSLLMLICMLERAGISVVSANTDGVVIKCLRRLEPVRDMLVKHWEALTQFETEAVAYRAIFSRDVNSYMAFKYDGEVKLKGAYAPPEPVGPSWPNPGREISVNAAIAFLQTGKPPIETIRECRDITKFVSVQNVKGGAIWNVTGEYLGKVVRWYYAIGRSGYIEYKLNGNKVPTSDGGQPCMDLPDTLPGDIDYSWYEREAWTILEEINYRGM